MACRGTHQTYDSPGDALAAITEATAIINSEIRDEDARTVRAEPFAGFEGSDFGDRIRKWLNKLEDMIRAIAKKLAALSYSITVSWPMGVSVSVTWTPS